MKTTFRFFVTVNIHIFLMNGTVEYPDHGGGNLKIQKKTENTKTTFRKYIYQIFMFKKKAKYTIATRNAPALAVDEGF